LYTSADFVKDCSKEKTDSQPVEDEMDCSNAQKDTVTISEVFR
jgi:hypothetical protein